MPQSPPRTSSTRTQVTGRRFSPSIATIVSVMRWILCCFCSDVNTPSMTLTWTSGIAVPFRDAILLWIRRSAAEDEQRDQGEDERLLEEHRGLHRDPAREVREEARLRREVEQHSRAHD